MTNEAFWRAVALTLIASSGVLAGAAWASARAAARSRHEEVRLVLLAIVTMLRREEPPDDRAKRQVGFRRDER